MPDLIETGGVSQYNSQVGLFCFKTRFTVGYPYGLKTHQLCRGEQKIQIFLQTRPQSNDINSSRTVYLTFISANTHLWPLRHLWKCLLIYLGQYPLMLKVNMDTETHHTEQPNGNSKKFIGYVFIKTIKQFQESYT